MRILLLLIPFLLNALSMKEAIDLSLTKSEKIKEQEYTKMQRSSEYRQSLSNFSPKINLTGEMQRQDYENVSGNSLGAGIEARVNIFSGFADIFNSLSQKDKEQAQKMSLNGTKEDVILDAKLSYLDVIKAMSDEVAAKDSLELVSQQNKEIEDSYTQGLVPKNDALRSRVELLNAEQNLLNMKILKNKAVQKLESLIGVKLSLELKELLLPEITQKDIEYENLSVFAKDRSEIKALEYLVSASSNDVKNSFSAYSPSVDVVGTYNFARDNIPSSSSGQFYSNQNTLSAKVELSYNLFNGLNDVFNTEAKKYTKMSLNARLAELKLTYDLELLSLIDSYKLSLKQLQTATLAIEQANENYRIVNNRYNERLDPLSELISARVLLTQSKSAYIFAQYNINSNLARIERATQKDLGLVK